MPRAHGVCCSPFLGSIVTVRIHSLGAWVVKLRGGLFAASAMRLGLTLQQRVLQGWLRSGASPVGEKRPVVAKGPLNQHCSKACGRDGGPDSYSSHDSFISWTAAVCHHGCRAWSIAKAFASSRSLINYCAGLLQFPRSRRQPDTKHSARLRPRHTLSVAVRC